MYPLLLAVHNLMRWLVVISLLVAIGAAAAGIIRKKSFTAADNAIRHWTATILHVQLVIGFTLYFSSPLIKFFWSDFKGNLAELEISFFALLHITLMLIAVVVATAGSALTKRRLSNEDKFKTMLSWYAVTLAIIFIGIPWPFSPFVHRPYVRIF